LESSGVITPSGELCGRKKNMRKNGLPVGYLRDISFNVGILGSKKIGLCELSQQLQGT